MRPIAVIDSETDPFKYGRIPEPFIWGFYNGTEYRQFDTVEDLILFLMDQDIIVYAHNGGKFDYHFLLDYLMEGEEVFVINGRIVQFKIGACEFRDSFSILPVGLAQFEKQAFDYRILERDRRDLPGNREKIEDYLRSDCINLYDMVTGFIAEYGAKLTLAGTAMKTWEKMTKRKAPRSTKEYFHQFSQYYYGGRVQCFEKGLINDDFSVYDINSAYPRAMLERHAFSLDAQYLAEMPDMAGDLFCNGFYSVRGISRGAFPYRAESGKLVFPDDDEVREYHVTGWEYKAAIDTGTFEQHAYLGGWMHSEFIDFGDYIGHFWELRKAAKAAGDKGGDLFAKLLMNSLYGKWASNPEHYHKFRVTQDQDRLVHALTNPEATYKHIGELGPWAVLARPLNEDECRYYNVATAASITGYVRAFLWRSICAAEGVMYCDTDSIACRRPGGILIGKQLGEWKWEGDFDFAAIAGRKLYAFHGKDGDWKTASKGAKLTPEQIQEIAAGGSAWYEFASPTFSINRGVSFVARNILATT